LKKQKVSNRDTSGVFKNIFKDLIKLKWYNLLNEWQWHGVFAAIPMEITHMWAARSLPSGLVIPLRNSRSAYFPMVFMA
jgi:hypothetical protein